MVSMGPPDDPHRGLLHRANDWSDAGPDHLEAAMLRPTSGRELEGLVESNQPSSFCATTEDEDPGQETRNPALSPDNAVRRPLWLFYGAIEPKRSSDGVVRARRRKKTLKRPRYGFQSPCCFVLLALFCCVTLFGTFFFLRGGPSANAELGRITNQVVYDVGKAVRAHADFNKWLGRVMHSML